MKLRRRRAAAAGSGPALRNGSLVVGSIATVIAVAAAIALTFTFGARAPRTDEAALRAIVAGGAPESAASEQVTQAQPPAPTVTAVQPADPTPVPPSPIPATPVPATTIPATPVPPASDGVTFAEPEDLMDSFDPAGPTPVPTTTLAVAEIVRLPAGRVTVPVGPGVSFELFEPRDSIHLPGISAIYLSDTRTSEVDIFVPVATASGQPLATFDDVIEYVETDPLFASLQRWDSVNWNEFRTVGFYGPGQKLELAFYTDPASVGDPTTGWRMPDDMDIWFIDTNAGTIAVTSESLAEANPAEYTEAVGVMLTVLETIGLGRG